MAHSVQYRIDAETVYYACFEIKEPAGSNQVVATAVDCRPLLTENGNLLSSTDLFLAGVHPDIVNVGGGTIRSCNVTAPRWQTLTPRGDAKKFEDNFLSHPRSQSGIRIFFDGVVSLMSESGEYALEGNFLTAADYTAMQGDVAGNHVCMTSTGDEIIYQPGGGYQEIGRDEYHVAKHNGTHTILKVPMGARLLAAERVRGVLTLVVEDLVTQEICVWEPDTGQLWRCRQPKTSFVTWDPQNGEVLLTNGYVGFELWASTSDFVLWHYQEEREEEGKIERPEMLRIKR